MSRDKDFDEYLNNLDSADQQALNSYMDNLDLEDNKELDEYLDRIEAGQHEAVPDIVEPMGVDVGQEYSQQEFAQDMQQPEYNLQPQPEVIQESATGLGAYIELEPEIESFQDYTTARMKPVTPDAEWSYADVGDDDGSFQSYEEQPYDDVHEEREKPDKKESPISPDSPLNVSLLDEEYEQPYVDTIRHKDDEDFGSSAFIDNSPNEKKNGKGNGLVAVIVAVLILAIVGGGVFATYHFTKGFKDFSFIKKEPTTEATTQEVTTTEATTEEATTEEPKGPYATVDYTLHTPHATDSTIVYNSNPFSLRFPKEEWPIFRDDNDNQRDATQEELYPSITLEARDGSLNSTNPNPDNIPETQMLTSRYMVLVDLSDDSIVAKRDSDVVVNPASMTKILTVLTAADLIEDLDDTFIMTDEAIRYAYDNGGSAVGFLAGEKVTVRDLIYGTIVCSGADAAVGLAQYCCGSHEAFVEKMNEKAEELGISDTAHFTNVVGMYDENLHCTMEDMAVIIATAMQNDLLKDVLSARTYQTTPDPNVLPEDVRKAHGIGVDGTNDSSTGNDSASGDQDTDSQDADAQDEAANTGEGQTSADDSTTEEIDPGVLLIATDGIQISNWFMRRIEDKDTGGEVLGAKTGFVNAAGFCCASYYKSKSGKEYVCVTGDTYSSWRCIYDHVGIYRSLAN